MANLLDYGLQGLDWWQQNQSFDESREDINKGFDQARGDIKQYQEPYQQFGLEHMQGYNDLGEFSFSNEDFYRDPSYKFRLDESLKQTQRSQAAQKMLGSGSTLEALTSRAGDLASQEYQSAYDRSLGTYDTNRAYHQFPVEQGARTAESMGQNLSDISGARGMTNAAIEQAKAQSMSGLIGGVRDSMGYTGAQPGIGGGMLDAAGNWISDTVGGAVGTGLGWLGDQAKGLFGAGATDAAAQLGISSVGGLSGLGGTAGALGTGGMFGSASGIGADALGTGAMWGSSSGMDAGALGVNEANFASFGGDFSAATAELATSSGVSNNVASAMVEEGLGDWLSSGATSAATTGFATWAGYVAGGLGGLFALSNVVSALRGNSKFEDAAQKISGSKDPLGAIQKLPSADLGRDVRHSEDNWFKMDDSSARGALYSTVLKGMSTQDAVNLRQHTDIDKITKDLFNYAKSGAGSGSGADSTKALIALFPEMEKDINRMAAGAGADWNSMEAQLTWDDIGGNAWEGSRAQEYYEKAASAGRDSEARVIAYMTQQQAAWRGDRLEAQALEGLV